MKRDDEFPLEPGMIGYEINKVLEAQAELYMAAADEIAKAFAEIAKKANEVSKMFADKAEQYKPPEKQYYFVARLWKDGEFIFDTKAYLYQYQILESAWGAAYLMGDWDDIVIILISAPDSKTARAKAHKRMLSLKNIR